MYKEDRAADAGKHHPMHSMIHSFGSCVSVSCKLSFTGLRACDAMPDASLPAQVFFYLFFINNLFITSTLIVGASSVITTLTGVSVEASCMLIPLGIVIYCVAGGLQVSFTHPLPLQRHLQSLTASELAALQPRLAKAVPLHFCIADGPLQCSGLGRMLATARLKPTRAIPLFHTVTCACNALWVALVGDASRDQLYALTGRLH